MKQDPATQQDPAMTNATVLRDATHEDLPAILAIHNEAVAHSVAIWTTTPATLDTRKALMDARRSGGFPFIAAMRDGVMAGYGSFGEFRSGDGYGQSVEHSVYVRSDMRGMGIGAMLLADLIEQARARDKHVMIGGIEAGNTASLMLHARFGFTETGRLPQTGRKFGRWLDLVFMQKIL
jgi:L-amino acid N-acyltransferase YncA